MFISHIGNQLKTWKCINNNLLERKISIRVLLSALFAGIAVLIMTMVIEYFFNNISLWAKLILNIVSAILGVAIGTLFLRKKYK